MSRLNVSLLVSALALSAPLAHAQDLKLKSPDGKPMEAISPKFKPSPEPKKAVTLAEIGWLSGCWKWTAKSHNRNIEQWSKAHGPIMLGVGAELRGEQVSSYEYMRIEPTNGKLVYTVKQKDKAERSFTQMSESPENLMFENPTGEFPHRVGYRKEGEGKMEVRVEGEVSGKMRAGLFPMEKTACE
jgi:hypothetical protein